MKRTLQYGLYGLGILATNYLLEFLAIAGCFRWHMHINLLLALVLGSLLLIGLALQPWYLLIPLCLYLHPISISQLQDVATYAPILVTLITGLVYRWLGCKGWFSRLRQKLTAMPRTRLAVGGLALLALFPAVVYACVSDFPASNRHAPTIFASQEKAQHLQQSISYSLTDDEWLWRVRVTPQQLAGLTTELNLSPIPPRKLPRQFFEKPHYWWNPERSERSLAFSTAEFPLDGIGVEGETDILALWNPASRTMYLWIKRNDGFF